MIWSRQLWHVAQYCQKFTTMNLGFCRVTLKFYESDHETQERAKMGNWTMP